MARGPLDRLEEEQAEKDRTKAADLIRQQGEMMQAGMAAWQSQAAAWQDAVTATINPSRSAGAANAPNAPTSGAALFGDLLEPGKRLGEAYREQMEAAFNRLKRDDAGR